MGDKERTRNWKEWKTLHKRAKWNGVRLTIRCRIQKYGYKDAQGAHRQLQGTEWNYNSMKKEIETINKNQGEMKNTISEIKNILEGITSRLDEAENWISELEHKVERNRESSCMKKD